jgi:acyl-CoA reductase-like NAD-dependent aldehyde dehydrogenase
MDISKLRFVKQLFINGRFVNSAKNQTFSVINPNDETVLAEIQRGSTEDIDAAVSAARHAF